MLRRKHPPVVIADCGREPTSADPVAYHMDPFAEPKLNSAKTYVGAKRSQLRREASLGEKKNWEFIQLGF